MLLFHAFTGCDVSAFCIKGKKVAWQAWEVSPVFKTQSILTYHRCRPQHSWKVCHYYIVCGKQSTAGKVDEARLNLFAMKQRSYDAFPPTSASRVQRVIRTASQVPAYEPGKCAKCKPKTCQKGLEIRWRGLASSLDNLPPVAQICDQLVKCSCKTESRGRSVHNCVPPNVRTKRRTNRSSTSTASYFIKMNKWIR